MALKQKINCSLNKIIEECSPQETRSPRRLATVNNYFRSLSRFETIGPAKLINELALSPCKIQSTPSVSPSKQKVNRVLKRYDYHHIPTNASRSLHQPKYLKLKDRKRCESHIEDMSFLEAVNLREKEDDSRRIQVLQKVIKENLKKQNGEMKISNRRRLKTIF